MWDFFENIYYIIYLYNIFRWACRISTNGGYSKYSYRCAEIWGDGWYNSMFHVVVHPIIEKLLKQQKLDSMILNLKLFINGDYKKLKSKIGNILHTKLKLQMCESSTLFQSTHIRPFLYLGPLAFPVWSCASVWGFFVKMTIVIRLVLVTYYQFTR